MLSPFVPAFIRRQVAIGDAQAAFTFDLARGVPRAAALRARVEAARAARLRAATPVLRSGDA